MKNVALVTFKNSSFRPVAFDTFEAAKLSWQISYSRSSPPADIRFEPLGEFQATWREGDCTVFVNDVAVATITHLEVFDRPEQL